MIPTFVSQHNIINRFYNRKEVECIVVDIEENEYIACEKAANNYWSSGKKGFFGAGTINTKDDETKTERTGLLGQMAFGKLVNEPVDLVYRRYGDEHDNLILNKYKVDVKCAARDYGANLIQKTNEFGVEQRMNKDIYVCSYVKSEDRNKKKAVVVAVGFCLLKDVLNAKVAPARRGNHINYEIYFHKLQPMTKLIETIGKYKQLPTQLLR